MSPAFPNATPGLRVPRTPSWIVTAPFLSECLSPCHLPKLPAAPVALHAAASPAPRRCSGQRGCVGQAQGSAGAAVSSSGSAQQHSAHADGCTGSCPGAAWLIRPGGGEGFGLRLGGRVGNFPEVRAGRASRWNKCEPWACAGSWGQQLDLFSARGHGRLPSGASLST